MSISTEEALEIILRKTRKMPSCKTELLSSLGYVLAQDIRAKIDVPPFDNSAMDGFAINAADVNRKARLTVAAEVKAGSHIGRFLKKGEAISIMTGGVILKGAAAVVPIENVIVDGKSIEITNPVGKGANIRKRGEDISKGSVVAKKGNVIKPIHISIVASIGVSELKVYARPKVALVVTGDELVEPDKKLRKGQIYNSNRYFLRGLLQAMGIGTVLDYKASDNLKNTVDTLRKALSKSDIVLTTGGISVGKYDYVSAALSKIGAACHFSEVKQKPGKPLSFFTYNKKLILSLPGNPVAVAVCYELYVRPTLLKISGNKHIFRKETEAVLTKTLKKKKGRKNWIRVNLRAEKGRYIAEPTGPQGSGILTSMLADGIAVIKEEQDVVERGHKIQVIYLDDDYK